MKNLLVIGCGDIGLRTAALLGRRYRIFALSHTPARFAALRESGIIPIPGDLDDRGSLSRIAGIAQTVLHLAPPPPSGRVDSRTRNLVAALSAKCSMLPQRLVYISTSGVYGDCAGERVTETRPARPMTERAARRLDAENRIRTWGRETGVTTAILRVPGILSGERIVPGRLAQPVLAEEDDVYTNHIHGVDLARAVALAADRALPGRIYNVCDDSEMKMGEYFGRIARRLGMPPPPRMARAEIEKILSPTMYSFLCESRRLDNARAKAELGLDLVYPHAVDGP